MDMQRSVGAGRRWHRPGPGGRSSNTSVAEDGGQDTEQWVRGREDSVGAAGRTSMQHICHRGLCATQRKDKGAIRHRHIDESKRTDDNDKQGGLNCVYGGPELRTTKECRVLHWEVVHDQTKRQRPWRGSAGIDVAIRLVYSSGYSIQTCEKNMGRRRKITIL